MSRWSLIIDIAKCHDCNNCFLACKDEFVENDWSPYSVSQPAQGHKWINIMRRERGQYPMVDVAYLPIPCMHCDDADCVKAAEKGAVYQREDGIVIIDPVKAKGQKAIVDSCPYGVIFWNEELDIPQKCTFCAHLLDDGWAAPRCAQACPTGALTFLCVEDSEMQREVESEGLETLHPEYGLEPRVYYKNLFRYTRCFVAGSVALRDEDECAEGATVTLTNDSQTVSATTVTNNYGDFVIDGLEEDSGPYNLGIEFTGYQKQSMRVELKGSLNVGTIFL
jgi:Fe-S-cluster-containing dehydrogenase component